MRLPAFVRHASRAVVDAFVHRVMLHPTVYERYSRSIFLNNAAHALQFNRLSAHLVGDFFSFSAAVASCG